MNEYKIDDNEQINYYNLYRFEPIYNPGRVVVSAKNQSEFLKASA